MEILQRGTYWRVDGRIHKHMTRQCCFLPLIETREHPSYTNFVTFDRDMTAVELGRQSTFDQHSIYDEGREIMTRCFSKGIGAQEVITWSVDSNQVHPLIEAVFRYQLDVWRSAE